MRNDARILPDAPVGDEAASELYQSLMSASPQPVVPHSALHPTDIRATTRSDVAKLEAEALLTGLLSTWHLLSLDAPTVAAVWVVFIADAAHVALPWTAPAAMFVAVWMLYAADRLLDARILHTQEEVHGLEARHRFHFRHRLSFLVVMALCCPVLMLLLRYTNPAAMRLHLTLGSLLAAWLSIVHLRPAAHRLPKELAVGIFFPAAVSIPTVARAPELRLDLLPAAILFAAVCSLNCLYIYAWEHPHDQRQAHITTRRAVRRLPQISSAALLTTSLSVCMLFAFLPSTREALALPALACAVSIVCLQVLDRMHSELRPVTLRAAADMALLTPVPLLLLLHR